MTKKSSNREKTKWLFLLFIAILCFVLAFSTQQLIFNFIAIALAVYIYKYGNPILFKEYDERRKNKYEEAMQVRKAAQTAISSKRIFKK
ncbi:hypothetical protein [Enterococcus malodoratus]|uniref:Uncharacterized protein n=1 Tax=Enterococcus malodoratus ATCC 43197 TaxID=1158601 RepID=R2NTT2_9ENTE|nr:hypothetical protein [Enterococcus malodoratus]EOH74418.1 hypothetical protein UAI_03487 [Enterococcus malodoratus ATCC 43197]EOT67148.1 hypothetical protein I585_02669 [Enterococcus malodoratus ATCC 43197]OJG57133.1 hypothetical protein RV07_GL003650 [Enterococcus malodoratus]SET78470.1 hypothetical protein SAMN04487821_12246 [Enterococcus malodoratus]SPW90974.1 Uncharacterised protein [Enterococcus malodoratus]